MAETTSFLGPVQPLAQATAPRMPVPVRAAPRTARSWSWLTGAVLPVVLLALWEVLARLGVLPPNLLPAPSRVLATIAELARTGELWGHVGVTLGRVALGFVLGSALATVFGAATGYSWRLQLLDPLLQGVRNIPSLAWVPLFILWMGIYETSKVALIAVGMFSRCTST